MVSAVSGLKSHQTKMDVIGNNIANVNTVGFKSSRVTFQEIFSESLRGASAADDYGRGGTNPMQVGLGTSVASVDTIFTRGSIQRTDNITDLAIEGEGMFVLKGGNSDPYMFTRAGNFIIDEVGNLVSAGGLRVYGWQYYERQADGSYVFDTELPLEPINIYNDEHNFNKKVIAAKATTQAVLSGNLDATNLPKGTDLSNIGQPHFSTPVIVYDSLGNEYEIRINFWKVETTTNGTDITTRWYWTATPGSADPVSLDSSAAAGYISFDSKGKPVQGAELTPSIIVIPNASQGSEPMEIKLNFNNLTMYADESSVMPASVDGYKSGTLVSMSIGSDGVIMGVYSNGRRQPLGMIALASFSNPSGLEKVGENLYLPTANSGDFTRGYKPGTSGVGKLSPGTLEMSNVDLAKEFTEMIVTQRGFQANSRIITASDEMLQELVNIRR